MTDQELQIFNAPGIIKKEDLDVRFGGAPVRPQVTSPDMRSSSDRRYLRRMAEWESTREREIADEERARAHQRQDVADEMNQKKMMLDEASGLIQQEAYRAKLDHQAAVSKDELAGIPELRGLNAQDPDFLLKQANVYVKYPHLGQSEVAKSISDQLNTVHSTWSSSEKAVKEQQEKKDKEDQANAEKLALQVGEAGLPVEEHFKRVDGKLVPLNPSETLLKVGAAKTAREAAKVESGQKWTLDQAERKLSQELAGEEKAIAAAEQNAKDNPETGALTFNESYKKSVINRDKLRGELEDLRTNRKPDDKTPAKGEDKFIVGNVYKDASGNSATYLGNGKWK